MSTNTPAAAGASENRYSCSEPYSRVPWPSQHVEMLAGGCFRPFKKLK